MKLQNRKFVKLIFCYLNVVNTGGKVRLVSTIVNYQSEILALSLNT